MGTGSHVMVYSPSKVFSSLDIFGTCSLRAMQLDMRSFAVVPEEIVKSDHESQYDQHKQSQELGNILSRGRDKVYASL